MVGRFFNLNACRSLDVLLFFSMYHNVTIYRLIFLCVYTHTHTHLNRYICMCAHLPIYVYFLHLYIVHKYILFVDSGLPR